MMDILFNNFTDIETNITIPVKQIAGIQTAILQAQTQAAIIFFFIGLILATIFCYAIFLMWKKLEIYQQIVDKEKGELLDFLKPVPSRRILREQLAALEHDQWNHWTQYMLENLTEDNIARWTRQIRSHYSELTEKEKESDREWADKVLDLLDGGEGEGNYQGDQGEGEK
jgi:hypothetical protein